MHFKEILFFSNLILTQAKGYTNFELRTKVLDALRAKSEVAEFRINQSEMGLSKKYRLSFQDLKPDTLRIVETSDKKESDENAMDSSELSKFGFNAEILTYAFFNSQVAKPFGFSSKFHITYTPIASSPSGLTHFLVYYDKAGFYPVKVSYYKGDKKMTTIEYKEYKKLKNQVWRAHLLISENHLNQKSTRIEFSNIEINPASLIPRLGSKGSEKEL